jgi:hypothetical protein
MGGEISGGKGKCELGDQRKVEARLKIGWLKAGKRL